MSNVFDINAARVAKQGQSTPPTTKKRAPVKRIVTNQQVFQETWEDVLHDWQIHATKNHLSEFIKAKLPYFAQGPDNADYLNDLNVVVFAEQKLGMKVTMCYPGVTPSNPDTWIVGFYHRNEVFTSSPEMMSEANARALNILLFLSFSYRMKKLKR